MVVPDLETIKEVRALVTMVVHLLMAALDTTVVLQLVMDQLVSVALDSEIIREVRALLTMEVHLPNMTAILLTMEALPMLPIITAVHRLPTAVQVTPITAVLDSVITAVLAWRITEAPELTMAVPQLFMVVPAMLIMAVHQLLMVALASVAPDSLVVMTTKTTTVLPSISLCQSVSTRPKYV